MFGSMGLAVLANFLNNRIFNHSALPVRLRLRQTVRGLPSQKKLTESESVMVACL